VDRKSETSVVKKRPVRNLKAPARSKKSKVLSDEEVEALRSVAIGPIDEALADWAAMDNDYE